ncbi:porphobilinogen deaminase-like [Lineus longissimus]|uniref:porphobilinogen deaminase-like n=1 Tax=Lineus longissimus TaxID=88925 RepID=UPI002B4DD1FF
MDEGRIIRVGSRKSQLALIQSNHVIGRLQRLFPGRKFELISMSTTGDVILDKALSKIGEKSLFTKELEVALEEKSVDMVVHSLKDLPTLLPPNMAIASVLERDDPRDAVVFTASCKTKKLEDLPPNSAIGTSSLRRIAQLKRKYPLFRFENIRGNLNTRFRKLDEGNMYAAIVLAKAGLERMEWHSRIDEVLEPSDCMYAVSQGALAVECRSDDQEMIEMLSTLHHTGTLLRVVAERAFLRTLEGGCTVPVAVHTVFTEGDSKCELSMDGGVFSLDGFQAITNSMQTRFTLEPVSKKMRTNGPSLFSSIVAEDVNDSALAAVETLGRQLAETLLQNGAKPILDEAKAEAEAELRKQKVERDLKRNEACEKAV